MDPVDRIDQQYRNRLRSEVVGMLIALVVCAAGGFYMYGGFTASESAIERVFVWSLRVGVVAFAVGAGLSVAGVRAAWVVDMIVCGGLTPILLVAGGVLAWTGYMDGFVILIAGLLAGGAAVRAWREYQAWGQSAALTAGMSVPVSATPDQTPPEPGPVVEAQTEPKRAATIEPVSPPDDPPPEGGYLAELGRQDD